ncbi:Lipoyl synthase [Serratia symbiotica]|nr:Lipoyl synthase [Serratia symbiotica]
MELIPVKIISNKKKELLCKPSWLKIKLPINTSRINNMKVIMRKNNINSVCEETSCPNIFECFNNGTATFIILGIVCTRRCPFCEIKHGRPMTVDINEPKKLAQTIFDMNLSYVVITSVNRDDLYDGGAQHFSNCIAAIRMKNKYIKIEILVPDFRNCMNRALNILKLIPPDIFNHNIESVPRIYHKVRPGANYIRSLKLLKHFKEMNPCITTKSGLIVGLGETNKEIIKVMYDLYYHGVTMLTIGQYLQPSKNHLPIKRYVSLSEFDNMKKKAIDIGFVNVACGPFIRSSYHAEFQAKRLEIK